MEKNGVPAAVPIRGILVNQGSRKVKLEGEEVTEEELCHFSVKMENEWRGNYGRSEDEGLDETLTVTKEEIGSTSQSMPEDSDGQGQRSSCPCQEEIETLKCTVKQLTVQMKKQNEEIKKHTKAVVKQKELMSGIKSCLRNVALSLITFCDEDDDKDDVDDGGDGLQEFSEDVENSRSATPNPQDNLHDFENGGSTVTIVNCVGNYSGTQIPSEAGVSYAAVGSSETFANEVGNNVGQTTSEEEPIDLDEFNLQNDDGKDSSYVPDDENEEDPGEDMEDEQNYHEPSISSSKSVKTKDGFQCSKCVKNFKLRKHLANHMQRAHLKNNSTIKCHLCAKCLFDSVGLKRHVQSVHEGVRYQCDHCPGKFRSLKSVQQHELTVHKEGGGPTQQCKVCGTHLKSERSLQNHMSKMHKKSGITKKRVQRLRKKKIPETETSRRIIFQCQLCPASFPERDSLHSHQRRVHGIDTYPGVETEK